MTRQAVTVVMPTVSSRADLFERLLGGVSVLSSRAPVVVRHVEGTPPKADPPRVFLQHELAQTQWALQLQDDAVLGPDAYRIPEILCSDDAAPFDVVSFFSLRDGADGLSRIPPKSFCSNVCVATRTESIKGLSDYAKRWYDRHPQHIHASDYILRDFASEHRLRVAVYFPSLVQHLPVASALGPRSTKRQSPTYRRVYGEL